MGIFDFSSDDVLLDIDAVCTKLCISRSSLERLRRNKLNITGDFDSTIDIQSSKLDDLFGVSFPEPTLSIGRSPRWSARVLNEWVDKMSKMKN